MKKNILLIFIILFCIACRENQKKVLIEYDKDLQDFPSFLVDIFPDTLGQYYLTVKGTDTTSQCIYYMSFDFDKKINLHDYLMKYEANDPNLIMIKREKILWWDCSKKKYYDNISIKEKIYYPIPFFEKRDILSIPMMYIQTKPPVGSQRILQFIFWNQNQEITGRG